MSTATSKPTLVCDTSDRAAWLEQRRTGIGASDAPGILGISPWSSPMKVAALKLGLEVDDEESELQRWGRYVEAPMIEAFKDETGWVAEPSGKMYRHVHPERGFMLVTLDGVVQRDDGKVGGIECKLKIFGAAEWEREGVPEHVDCQVQHGMEVAGFDFTYVLALLDGYRLRWKLVERDPDLIGDRIVPEERAFWRRFEAGEPQPIIGPASANVAALKAFYPEDSGREVRLAGPEWLERLEAWNAAKKARGVFDDTAEGHRNSFAAAMGDATFAVLDDGTKLSLKTTRRAAYPVKATSFRVLREVGKK